MKKAKKPQQNFHNYKKRQTKSTNDINQKIIKDKKYADLSQSVIKKYREKLEKKKNVIAKLSKTLKLEVQKLEKVRKRQSKKVQIQ